MPSHRPAPRLTPKDIDRICEDELCDAGLLPCNAGEIRIDRFIERRFGIVPEYLDIDRDGASVFDRGTGRLTRIIVRRRLAESGTERAQRRVQSTLAHEAAHGLLHGTLHRRESDTTESWVERGGSSPTRKGRSSIGSCGVPKCRCEAQANAGIGALLLPWPVFFEGLLYDPEYYTWVMDEGEFWSEIHRLADVYTVSPDVVWYRLMAFDPAKFQALAREELIAAQLKEFIDAVGRVLDEQLVLDKGSPEDKAKVLRMRQIRNYRTTRTNGHVDIVTAQGSSLKTDQSLDLSTGGMSV